MIESQVDSLERRTGALPIESELAAGLYYFIYPGDTRIAIGGAAGIAILTRAQALAVASELGEIVREHLAREAG